jgi:glucan-binding YG repeat protein
MWAGSFATAGWFTMHGNTYAINMHGIVYTGISMVQFSNEAPTVYEFTEEGVLVRKFGTGLFIHNGKTYYLTDGTVTKGLVLAEDGHYYYFSTTYNYAAVTGRYYVTYDNGLGITGFQEFDEQGRMIVLNDGIREIDGVLYYVENGAKCGKGLVKIGEDYYYARSSGQLAIGRYYVTNDNGYGYVGWQEFGADGKMILEGEGEVKDGFITEDGKLYYYVNGEKLSNGLFKVGSDFYYARSSGQLATGRYYVTNDNGYGYVGWQEFGADGKMVLESAEEPEEPKNGIYEEDGKLFYYVNGVKLSNGLFKVGEDYYYARSSGQLAVGKYFVTNSNGLPYSGWQEFGTDGKLIIQ